MQTYPWPGNTSAAKEMQQKWCKKLNFSPLNTRPSLIAGADISCNRFEKTVYAGIVVLDYASLDVIERTGVVEEVAFPYIPGYLSFREVPSLMKAWNKLKVKPTVVMLDGHGVLHPRRMGVASHFALEAKVATLGCAKKRLTGDHALVDERPGQYQPVHLENKLSGYVLRSRKNANPIYISPGNRMDCDDALHIAMHCLKGYRLPEPTRQAHLYVNELRKSRQ